MMKRSKDNWVLCAIASFVFLPSLVEADRDASDDFSEEDRAAVRVLQVPEGLTVSLFANGAHLTNPVALDVDKDGRVYVAETYAIQSRDRREPFPIVYARGRSAGADPRGSTGDV